MSKLHGLKTRIWDGEFREGILWLLGLLKDDHAKLPTVMCNGWASRLHELEFRKNVKRLLSVGFSHKKIITLLGDGSCVAKISARVSDLINVGPTISRKRAREL